MISQIGKFLILVGVVLTILGVLLVIFQKSGLPFGKLPGDFIIRKENFTLYAPFTTSLILSIILTLVLWIFKK